MTLDRSGRSAAHPETGWPCARPVPCRDGSHRTAASSQAGLRTSLMFSAYFVGGLVRLQLRGHAMNVARGNLRRSEPGFVRHPEVALRIRWEERSARPPRKRAPAPRGIRSSRTARTSAVGDDPPEIASVARCRAASASARRSRMRCPQASAAATGIGNRRIVLIAQPHADRARSYTGSGPRMPSSSCISASSEVGWQQRPIVPAASGYFDAVIAAARDGEIVGGRGERHRVEAPTDLSDHGLDRHARRRQRRPDPRREVARARGDRRPAKRHLRGC